MIYTTNAIEALNSKIRRAVRTRGHFPSDEAAAKLIYLALNATSTEWNRSGREWHAVKSQPQSCSKIASQWRNIRRQGTKLRTVFLAKAGLQIRLTAIACNLKRSLKVAAAA